MEPSEYAVRASNAHIGGDTAFQVPPQKYWARGSISGNPPAA